MTHYGFQAQAVASVHAAWQRGTRGVCLVGPTGCGKTRMGWSAIADSRSALWVTHRYDLRRQNVFDLRHLYDERAGKSGVGRERVAAFMPGRKLREAPITVASIQTLMREPKALDGRRFEHMVIDECAHYRADQWQLVTTLYGQTSRVLGMTAFPQRRDKRSLRTIFGEMVVAANYEQLIGRVIVGARIWRPEQPMGRALAMSEVEAWRRYSGGRKTFLVVPRIARGVEVVNEFRAAGINADLVRACDSEEHRKTAIGRFRDPCGSKVLVSVDVFTEGLNAPEASCVLIAKPIRYVGSYMQLIGRALRVLRDREGKIDPSKDAAVVIDLVGASALHGATLGTGGTAVWPGADVDYQAIWDEQPTTDGPDEGPKSGPTEGPAQDDDDAGGDDDDAGFDAGLPVHKTRMICVHAGAPPPRGDDMQTVPIRSSLPPLAVRMPGRLPRVTRATSVDKAFRGALLAGGRR